MANFYTNSPSRFGTCFATHDPTEPQTVVVSTEAVKIGTGGIDPAKKKRQIFKPTGILHLPKAKEPAVQKRLEESSELHEQIAGEVAKEFFGADGGVTGTKPIEQMSMAEMDAEIGELLRREFITQDEELRLLILMAASA